MSPQIGFGGSTRDRVKSPAKVEANGVGCSPFAHKPGRPVTEGNLVGWAQFISGRSMLVVPSHLLLLPEGGTCEDFSVVFTGTKVMLTIP